MLSAFKNITNSTRTNILMYFMSKIDGLELVGYKPRISWSGSKNINVEQKVKPFTKQVTCFKTDKLWSEELIEITTHSIPKEVVLPKSDEQ